MPVAAGRKTTMKKTIKNVIFTLLLLTLSASTALLAYLHFFASDDDELSGEWTAELDMTQQAAITALDWLQDIEAVSISLEDMESYMQNLTIQISLTLEQTDSSEGTFTAMSCRKAMMPVIRRLMRHLPQHFMTFWQKGFAWQTIWAAQTRRLLRRL